MIDKRAGTDWIVDRIAELVERHRPVAVALDPGAPAGSLVTDLSTMRRVPPLVLVGGRAVRAGVRRAVR